MNLGARLFAYTDNSTYGEYAEKSWLWMESIGLISGQYVVFDGSDTLLNCSELSHVLWTYNAGMALHTAAVMWNKTEDWTWKHRTNGIWNASLAYFFNQDKIMYETSCENYNTIGNCNLDQQR